MNNIRYILFLSLIISLLFPLKHYIFNFVSAQSTVEPTIKPKVDVIIEGTINDDKIKGGDEMIQ
jgi:hypothetical protein